MNQKIEAINQKIAELTPRSLALDCIPKRGITLEKLWVKYRDACDRQRVMPLYPQFRTAMKRLYADGKVGLSADETLIVRRG